MAFDLKASLKQNKALWIFVGAAIVVALLLGIFVSPYASSSPDGLEKVAEDKGFLEAAEEKAPTWTHSPLPDYQLTAVKNERVSTGISGLLGVLLTLAVALVIGLAVYGAARLLGKKEDSETGSPLSET